MKKIQFLSPRPVLRGLALALAVSGLSSYVAQAHPYAAGITVSGGNVNFLLNESADDVKVVFDNGTSATNDLGALVKGTNSFALGAHTNYSIIVYKVGSGSPSVISADTNRYVNFYGPRGLTVNRNPKTSNFGRTYVVNASGAATPIGGSGTSYGLGNRTVGRGIYVLNSDQSDAFGQGDTALLGGMTLGSSTTYSPYRVGVGPDDMVYVADASGSYTGNNGLQGGVWMANPNFTTVQDLFVAGSTSEYDSIVGTPFVTGSYAAGNLVLYALNRDLAGYYDNVLQYNIGGGPLPYTGTFTSLGSGSLGAAGVGADMAIGPDGKIYMLLYRGTPAAGNPCLRVFDASGNALWNSWDNYGATFGDPYNYEYGIAISPDGTMMATLVQNGLFAITRLTNGIPDVSSFATFNSTWNGVSLGTGSSARGIAFDAANNVYITSGTLQMMRVCSLGITTTAITSNDSTATNGTFQLLTPPTSVSVTASTNEIFEAGPTTATYTITRVNPNDDYTAPLTVNFTFGGTAKFGVHYVASATNTITMAAGQTSTNITITAQNDHIATLTESAILQLGASGFYSAIVPKTAEVDIVDSATPMLRVTALSTNVFEGNPYDYAAVTITRYGDTNIDGLVVNAANFSITGTAVANVDYYVTNLPMTLSAGQVTTNFPIIAPLNNNLYDGNKTLTIGLATAGTGYTISNSVLTTTIVEADYGTETVLFQDNLQADTSANWTVAFGAQDPTTGDYSASWAFDYSSLSIPPAPHSGTDTHGLRLTVNKSGLGPAAGVNLYPTGQWFSNNYALRFDMYLIQGTAGTTEYALFGINHSGTKTNWFRNSTAAPPGVPAGWQFDGLWNYVEADGAGYGDYVLNSSPALTNASGTVYPASYASRVATTLTGVFKSPPYTVGAYGGGAPANLLGSTTPSWAEVEIMQLGNQVIWKINNTLIFSYVNTNINTAAYTNGNIMIGYDDAYDGVGSAEASVIFANLRVVKITPPVIITPPHNVQAAVGSATSLSVVVSTSTGLTNYQWYFNGAAVAGATSNVLNFASVTFANYGSYTVKVDDGTLTYATASSPVTLTAPPPVINTPPANQIGAPGGIATFGVTATTYSSKLSYQWLTNGVPVVGKTNATFSITNLAAVNFASTYSVYVNDTFTSVTSTPAATLTKASTPTLTVALGGANKNLTFGSQLGPKYYVEYKTNLTDATWKTLSTNSGTGSNIVVTDTVAAPQRFYRILVQ